MSTFGFCAQFGPIDPIWVQQRMGVPAKPDVTQAQTQGQHPAPNLDPSREAVRRTEHWRSDTEERDAFGLPLGQACQPALSGKRCRDQDDKSEGKTKPPLSAQEMQHGLQGVCLGCLYSLVKTEPFYTCIQFHSALPLQSKPCIVPVVCFAFSFKLFF